MPAGAGKYDDVATTARRDTEAQGVVLIVLAGKHGSGFSVQASAEVTFALPSLLRQVADDIEQSFFQSKGRN
jgi:hypothetical protein